MALPRPASPRALWADIQAFLIGGGKHRLLIGLAAIAMPMIIVFGFVLDARTNIEPKGLKIVYAQSWPADRTDDEIKKLQVIDQKKRDAERLEKQRAYQRLAKQLGIE